MKSIAYDCSEKNTQFIEINREGERVICEVEQHDSSVFGL